MKALCVKEPWASLIMEGRKTIETRTRNIKYRADILIVASKKPVSLHDLWFNDSLKVLHALQLPDYLLGHALCVAELYDCRRMVKDHVEFALCPVYDGAYSWFLRNVRKIKPFPLKGKLGLFDVDQKFIEVIK
ncbi:MAG: ASCH domain-containing protein [Ignavibacteriales bacterium]|nr:ASCH domain-containing protein [Ignavibacteriales bacterium]